MENQLVTNNIELESCKNCEKQFEDGFAFCPHCGQQAHEDLTVSVLFYNTITNYFSFDARFFKSFIPLMAKPGILAKRFIEGKRLMYLHPAQMYLFISVVFFFLMYSFVVSDGIKKINTGLKKTLDKPLVSDSTKTEVQQALDSVQLEAIIKPLKDNAIVTGMNEDEIKVLDSIISTNANKVNNASKTNRLSFGFNEKKIDSLIAVEASDEELYKAMGLEDDANSITRKFYAQMLKFYKQREGGELFKKIYDTIPIALFILLPIFTLILKLLFFNRGRFVNHLVFSFYYFSFLFTVFSIILLVNYCWDVPDWIDWLLVFSTFFYLVIAIKRFYGQGWFLSFFKTSLATFTYFIFVIPIAIVIIGLVGFMFY